MFSVSNNLIVHFLFVFPFVSFQNLFMRLFIKVTTDLLRVTLECIWGKNTEKKNYLQIIPHQMPPQGREAFLLNKQSAHHSRSIQFIGLLLSNLCMLVFTVQLDLTSKQAIFADVAQCLENKIIGGEFWCATLSWWFSYHKGIKVSILISNLFHLNNRLQDAESSGDRFPQLGRWANFLWKNSYQIHTSEMLQLYR